MRRSHRDVDVSKRRPLSCLHSVAVHVLLIRDTTILLARRYNTGYADGQWSLPAGHVESGESVTAAAVREAREETGVVIRPADLDVVHVMHRRDESQREWVNFFLATSRWEGEPRICEPDKCDRLEWVTYLAAMPPDTVPYVAYAVAVGLDGLDYSEYGWGTGE